MTTHEEEQFGFDDPWVILASVILSGLVLGVACNFLQTHVCSVRLNGNVLIDKLGLRTRVHP